MAPGRTSTREENSRIPVASRATGLRSGRAARGSRWARVSRAPGREAAFVGAYCLRVFDPDGPGGVPAKLVAGGPFLAAGGIPSRLCAAWDGTTLERDLIPGIRKRVIDLGHRSRFRYPGGAILVCGRRLRERCGNLRRPDCSVERVGVVLDRRRVLPASAGDLRSSDRREHLDRLRRWIGIGRLRRGAT